MSDLTPNRLFNLLEDANIYSMDFTTFESKYRDSIKRCNQFLPPYFRNGQDIHNISDNTLKNFLLFFFATLAEYKASVDVIRDSNVLETFKELAIRVYPGINSESTYRDVLGYINSQSLTETEVLENRLNNFTTYQSTSPSTTKITITRKDLGQYLTSNNSKFNLTNDIEMYQDVENIESVDMEAIYEYNY